MLVDLAGDRFSPSDVAALLSAMREVDAYLVLSVGHQIDLYRGAASTRKPVVTVMERLPSVAVVGSLVVVDERESLTASLRGDVSRPSDVELNVVDDVVADWLGPLTTEASFLADGVTRGHEARP